MDPDDPNYDDLTTISAPADTSVDGSLDINGAPNLADNADAVAQVDSTDFGQVNDIPPLDNINGTSGSTGDPTSSLDSMFSSANPIGDVLDYLTGGATGLADELSGLIDPTPANQPATSSAVPVVLIGIAALVLFIVVLK